MPKKFYKIGSRFNLERLPSKKRQSCHRQVYKRVISVTLTCTLRVPSHSRAISAKRQSATKAMRKKSSSERLLAKLLCVCFGKYLEDKGLVQIFEGFRDKEASREC